MTLTWPTLVELFGFKNSSNPGTKTGTETTANAQQILDAISALVAVINHHGEILDVNTAFIENSGFQKAEIVGKNYRDVFKIFTVDIHGKLIAEKDLLLTPMYNLFYQNPTQNKGNTHNKIYFTDHIDQREIYVDVYISPFPGKDPSNPSHQETGAVVLIQDISEQIQQEKLKLDFVSMAAHELRTPLAIIRGYLDEIRIENDSNLNAAQLQFIDRADISALHLVNLMENMLSAANIERGVYVLQTQELDWIEYLDERTEELRKRASDRNLELIWNHPHEPIPFVIADPLRIAEVINNLVANAINYTEKGSIEISTEYDKVKQNVTTHIRDTGPGIPESTQKRLFEKFFHVAGTVELGTKGTGFGLYISKNIVGLHGGRIWVESKIGHGSTFSFTLPVANKIK